MLRSNGLCRPSVKRALLVSLVLAAGVVWTFGCGTSDDGAGTTVGPGDGGPITHPSGADELVLQVFAHDGFVPVAYHLTQMPEFSLYGDGTVIVAGPTTMIYPPPALPNLQVATISEEAVQAILSTAREAGLFQNGVDYGRPGITDMPLTTIVINADGTTYSCSIYALGMEKDAGGLTMEQQQARAAISDLRGKLIDLESFDTGEIIWSLYEYSALAVYSVAIDPAGDQGSGDIQPNHLRWPLGDESTLGEPVEPEGYRMVVVSDQDLVELKKLLGEATQITVWTVGNQEYNLYFRPLLPDEIE